jgi:hypothetical protein
MRTKPKPTGREFIARAVDAAVQRTPVFDIHTHLYSPAFGSLLLWGIDELLTYHYLVAEGVRVANQDEAEFFRWPKPAQAEWIWDQLFLRHSPVSEACRGVLTTLNRLGLDVRRRDLPSLRRWFAGQTVESHVDRCLAAAGVERVCMTNSPFDEAERPVWEVRGAGARGDGRFVAALRIDPLLLDWPQTARRLASWGYAVTPTLSARTLAGVRRFLSDWGRRMGARYAMVSLGPEFRYPGRSACSRLLEGAVMPFCGEHGLPLALMLGVKRGVNPRLGLAGDGVGRSDLQSLQNLCAAFPEARVLATVLSLENQHELCVLARKFRNLHIFGCWWFTNVPCAIEEITRLRLELLGLSFTPQHSDARVLDQLIYKWAHFRQILSSVLVGKYTDLAAAGWDPDEAEIRRDVRELLGGAFERFCAGDGSPGAVRPVLGGSR